MTESYIINRSPALTFAKLNMNGDHIQIDNGLFVPEGVKATEEGAFFADKYTEKIPDSASGKDIDKLLTGKRDPYVTEGDAKVDLLFDGNGIVERMIRVPAGREVQLVEVVKGNGETAINSTVYILERGARLKLIRFQLLDNTTRYIDDLRARLAEDSSLEVVRLDLGSGLSYISSNVLLEGKDSEYTALGNYLLTGSQRLDINMIAAHIAPNTKSDMRADGVLCGSASKIFRGALDFKSGCKGAKGSENEDVIMLSEDADNQSLPIILCGEEDVEGNHGASVGKISDEILYYLACRGFDEETATRILIRARYDGIISLIEDDALKSEIAGRIDEVLQ